MTLWSMICCLVFFELCLAIDRKGNGDFFSVFADVCCALLASTSSCCEVAILLRCFVVN